MSAHYRRLWILSLLWLLKVPSEYGSIRALSFRVDCHEKASARADEGRRRNPFVQEFLDIVGVALDELDLLFLEERLGVADEDDINDLVIHVDWAHNTYHRLFQF